MWGAAPPAQPGMSYGGVPNVAQPAAQASNLKNDIFVGNLAFNTSEDQLHQAFSEIGRVINVRLVTDVETGKPRGFAFVEFQDAQAALSAIRNMNDYELNGRRLRVNFSNSSHLEALADKLGMDLSQQTQRATKQQPAASAGTNAVADSLKSMSKAEMYDVVAKLKEIADRDQDEARRILSGHPQLPEAMLFLMSKLDMVKTPIATEASAAAVLPTPAVAAPSAPARAADPRTAAVTRKDPRQQAAPAVSDPRAAASVAPSKPAPPPPPTATAAATTTTTTTRVDPRQRMDPRSRMAAAAAAAPPPPPRGAGVPPPPPPAYGGGSGVPPPPPPPPAGGGAPIDPSLVQQVMSLTPQQIQQLPPDKQQSIMALRQQITGGR